MTSQVESGIKSGKSSPTVKSGCHGLENRCSFISIMMVDDTCGLSATIPRDSDPIATYRSNRNFPDRITSAGLTGRKVVNANVIPRARVVSFFLKNCICNHFIKVKHTSFGFTSFLERCSTERDVKKNLGSFMYLFVQVAWSQWHLPNL